VALKARLPQVEQQLGKTRKGKASTLVCSVRAMVVVGKVADRAGQSSQWKISGWRLANMVSTSRGASFTGSALDRFGLLLLQTTLWRRLLTVKEGSIRLQF
jgi:hypothetical protein